MFFFIQDIMCRKHRRSGPLRDKSFYANNIPIFTMSEEGGKPTHSRQLACQDSISNLVLSRFLHTSCIFQIINYYFANMWPLQYKIQYELHGKQPDAICVIWYDKEQYRGLSYSLCSSHAQSIAHNLARLQHHYLSRSA